MTDVGTLLIWSTESLCLPHEGWRRAPGPAWTRVATTALRQLCLERQLTGNELPDAWLAAATMHLAQHLVSFDRGFKRLLGRGQFTLLEPGPA